MSSKASSAQIALKFKSYSPKGLIRTTSKSNKGHLYLSDEDLPYVWTNARANVTGIKSEPFPLYLIKEQLADCGLSKKSNTLYYQNKKNPYNFTVCIVPRIE